MEPAAGVRGSPVGDIGDVLDPGNCFAISDDIAYIHQVVLEGFITLSGHGDSLEDDPLAIM